ncbi:MAG: B12-binding domain-containing radical SAM protein [Candidatus Methylomirabilia bacterium]
MKKILLVGSNSLRFPYPVSPVGLCQLAAALDPRWRVRIFDPNAGGADLAAVVEQFAPDYVGLGIRNVDDVVMEEGVSFVNDVRERYAKPLRRLTRAPLILGGAGFSIFPQEWLEECEADYGVVGEGEAALPALLSALESGREPLGIPGVVAPGRPPSVRAAKPVLVDLLPFAGIDERIDYAPYRERGAYPIQTKRGCARRCVYCSYPQIEGRAFRCRPAEHVVDEIQQVQGRLGDVAFEFVDSVFNDPPGHAESICWEIAQRGLKVRLRTMGVNPANVTRELIDLMAGAGFAQIDSTPDSASPAMLESLRKGFTLAQLRQTAAIVREARMPTMWFFLLGGPGETERTILETFAFVDEFVDPEDMVHVSEGIRIFPQTALYDTAVREGFVEPGESLLHRRFYVSPELGRDRLLEIVGRETAARANCVRSSESTPPPALLQEAVRIRREQGLTEPMFRTLLRLRRQARGA